MSDYTISSRGDATDYMAAYEGFGETSLAVKTADSIDEIRNRRADYVLSDGPPTLSNTFKPSWKRIP